MKVLRKCIEILRKSMKIYRKYMKILRKPLKNKENLLKIMILASAPGAHFEELVPKIGFRSQMGTF